MSYAKITTIINLLELFGFGEWDFQSFTYTVQMHAYKKFEHENTMWVVVVTLGVVNSVTCEFCQNH